MKTRSDAWQAGYKNGYDTWGWGVMRRNHHTGGNAGRR